MSTSSLTGPLKTQDPNSVLQWKPYAEQASAKYGVPTPVLLGLIQEESGGHPGETSPTGAQGITQFEPGTAATYHVNTSPGGEYSQVMGAAQYLHDLGFSSNPTRALASYNAGPGNWQAGLGYANTVLSLATHYGHANTPTPTPTTPNTTTPTTAASGNPFLTGNPAHPHQSLHILLYATLLIIGAALAYLGITRTTGLHPNPTR
jgi:membrane-bound lytic murein transglycosylase B